MVDINVMWLLNRLILLIMTNIFFFLHNPPLSPPELIREAHTAEKVHLKGNISDLGIWNTIAKHLPQCPWMSPPASLTNQVAVICCRWLQESIMQCPLFLHRADSQRARNAPDAGILRRMVRDCSCHPVLRGVLGNLLCYLTLDLPAHSPDHAQHLPGEQEKIKDKTERSPETSRGATSGDLVPRHLTTFQLLQSKFMRSSTKAPISHQREVGTLSSRGASGDRRNSKGKEPERQNQTRRGQGHRSGGSVKDMVARFAMVGQKEKEGKAQKDQPPKPRLSGRGNVMTSLMERFQTVAAVSRGSAAAQVRLPTDVKQMVAVRERRQRGGSDHNVRRQNQPRKTKTQLGLKGQGGSSGREQGPGLRTPGTKSDTGKNHLKHSHQDPEDQCPAKAIKHQSCKKPRSEEANVIIQLKYGRLEVFCIKSVTETLLPEPYKLLPQVEGQMRCHVGTITTSSPVWSTCVHHPPKLYQAKPTENISSFNPLSEENSQNPPESGPGPQMEPTYLIPRVHRFTIPEEGQNHAGSFQRPAADSEDVFLNIAQPEYLDGSDAGRPACPPSTNRQILQVTIKEDQPQGKRAGEPTPAATEDTNTQQRALTKAEAAAEDGPIPPLSPSEGQCEADEQKFRPKYKTINYGDPSVKEAYKPKVIRFTDTFTFWIRLKAAV